MRTFPGRPLLVSLILTVFFLPIPAQGFEYVLGTDTYAMPSLPQPAKGESYSDPNFNTDIIRVTDKAIDGYSTNSIQNFYATTASSNSDSSYLILYGGNHVHFLYHGPNSATPYQYIRQLTFIDNSENKPHWDKTDPDKLYYTRSKYAQIKDDGPKLYLYRPSTDTSTLIHDFTDDPDLSQFFTGDNAVPNGVTYPGHYIATEEYNAPSWDCRYWGFWVNYRNDQGFDSIVAAFTYDMTTDEVLGLLYSGIDDITNGSKGMVSPSPLGNYVEISNSEPAGSNNPRSNYWDINLTHIIRESGIGGAHHSDWALDVNGVECTLVIDSDTTPVGPSIIYPGTGYRYKLIRTFPTNMHLSGNNYKTPGWGLISTYDTSNTCWASNQIAMIELDPSKALWRQEGNNASTKEVYYASDDPQVTVWRLAHTHAYEINPGYSDQPQATISPDGRYVYWKSDWSGQLGNREVFQIELPETWYEDLSGPMETCSSLNGSCCSSGQTCQGGTFQLSSDCGNLCCTGGGICQTPFEYVLGVGYYPEPDIPKPEKGGSYIDPNFHTAITRVTNQSDSYEGAHIRPVYVNVDTSNSDSSLLVLKSSANKYYLYHGPNSTTPYEFIRGLPFIDNAESSPHWDGNDPDVFYYVKSLYGQIRTYGPKFYSYSASSDTSTLLHDFTNEPGLFQFFTGDNAVPHGETSPGHYIHFEEYNEPSWDTRYWAFWVKFRTPTEIKAAFTYDLEEDRVLGILYSGQDDVSSLWKGICTVSPLGTYVLIRGNTSSNFWNLNLTSSIPGIAGVGHSDWALDVNGEEVLFFSDDQRDHWSIFYPSTGYKYGLQSRQDDGEYSDSHPCGHGYGKPGCGVVSTYVTEEPGDPWFEEQVFMIELDPEKARWKALYTGSRINLNPNETARIWRLAHHHMDYTGDYNTQPRATISHNGNYIYWLSNWDETSNAEVYQLELPETWYEDLMGPLDTCSSLGYQCCDACESGTEQTAYDEDCPGELCCGACAGLHRADTSEPFGCIDIGELTSFIELWFNGSQGVTMPELMQGVTLWRAGTGCS